MPLDFNAPLDRIIVLIKSISGYADDADGTAHVYKGVPGSLPTRASAYAAVVDPNPREKANQLQTIEIGYFVVFGYRIDPATEIVSLAAAETTLCAGLSGWADLMKRPTNRVLNNGTADLVRDARWESVSALSPQYMPLAGQEHRIVALLVRTQQDQTY